MEEGLPPQGMIRNISGYTIDFDGGITVLENTRLRFNFHLKLNTNNTWKRFSIRLKGPSIYKLEANAGEDALTLTIEEGDKETRHLIQSADLRDPAKLIGRIGGPFFGQLIQAAGVSFPMPETSASSTNAVSLGLDWSCRHDRMQIGHARLRVYRLEANLLDRFKIVVLVSHVGEILRIELPDQVVFVNEALSL